MSLSADQPVRSTPIQPERRSSPRYTVQVPIELHRDGTDFPLRTETTDLSRGGCYVQLSQTLTPGAYAHGRLWLDDSPVDFRGRVVTRHPQFGNGIMFLEFEKDGEQLLERYIEAIAI
ncbi:MAG: PilZ domain-containing protein [Terriglobales bacterium]|jgi:hypothetical protein